MPFLAPIGAAIWGAIGSVATFLGGGTLLAKVALAGLGIAAQYAANKWLSKKQQQTAPAQASQLETRYGEDMARTVVLGTVGTAGHHVYRNAYGKGNSIVQDVYVLSHFRITGVSRVRYKGEWRDIGGAVDGERGQRVQGIDAEVWVKIYTGTMSQTADTGLISRSNPTGRWTSAHKGAGVAYAVVTSVLHRENLPNPWEAFFEVQGPLLYDWRKDDTAGGDGDDRWSDQSTWSGLRDNPVLQMYALERGLFNGSERMVGKGVSASALPLSIWTQAANICDEITDGSRRYQSSAIASSGEGTTHDANMKPLLEACAASWLEIAGDEYPIVGAAQSSVATFTDDDLMVEESFRFSAKRTRTELVNTVAGSYVDPGSFYEAVPFTTRIDTDALAVDRERLAVSIPFSAVTVPACVDRLADIAIRASRYQGSADLCLHPKFLAVVPGQWITWTSARYGWTKVFQITSKRLGAFGERGTRNVYLSLQEVGDGVFDPTIYKTLPPDIAVQGPPDFLSEVQNFIAAGIRVHDAENDKQYPAIRVSWDAIDDPTVVAVDIRWRPQFQPDAEQSMQVPFDKITTVLTNGIISNSMYEVSTRLVANPARIVPWTDWEEVLTPNAAFNDITAYLNQLGGDVRSALEQVFAMMDETAARLEQLALAGAEEAGTVTQISAVARSFQNATAAAMREMSATINTVDGKVAAQAEIIDAVQVVIGDVSSGVLWRMTTEAGAGDVAARVVLQVRATIDDDWVSAGTLWEAGFTDQDPDQPFSRIVMNAAQFVITDGENEHAPLVFEDGVLKLNVVDIGTVYAGTVEARNGAHRATYEDGTYEWWNVSD